MTDRSGDYMPPTRTRRTNPSMWVIGALGVALVFGLLVWSTYRGGQQLSGTPNTAQETTIGDRTGEGQQGDNPVTDKQAPPRTNQ